MTRLGRITLNPFNLFRTRSVKGLEKPILTLREILLPPWRDQNDKTVVQQQPRSEYNKTFFSYTSWLLPSLLSAKNSLVKFFSKNVFHWKIITILIFLGLLLYSKSFNNPFLYDDKAFIFNSNLIKNWKNISKLFSPYEYFEYSRDITYRPIPSLLNFINYALWRENPVGYRVSSLLLHISNSILLYFLVILLLNSSYSAKRIGLFAALLFIAHPIQSESILEVTFNETLLVNLFYLCALYTYILSVDSSRATNIRKFYFICSVVSYLLALFSKETAVTLLLMIVFYDVCFRQIRFNKGFLRYLNWQKYLSYIFITGFFIFIRFFLFRHPIESMIGYPGSSFWTNIITMIKTIPLYLRLFILPVNLSIEYKIKTATSILEPSVIFGIVIFLVLLTVSFLIYRRSKKSFFFFMWIFIVLIPVSNIIPMQILAAERYLYSSMAGFCVLLTMAIWYYTPRKFPYLFLGLLLCFYGIVVVKRIGDWKDEFTFWKKAVYRVPYSDGAHNGLGWAFLNKDYHIPAIREFEQSLKLKPDYFEAQNSLASAYFAKGDYEVAIKEYYKAMKMNPYMPQPHFNLGKIYKIKEKYDKAIDEFKITILMNSSIHEAYVHLGDIYQKIGNVYEASISYDKAIKINPRFALSYNSLGIIFGDKGHHDIAIWYLRKAVELEPESCDMRFNLGYAYHLSGREEIAVEELNKVLGLCPDYKKARYVLSEINSKNE